MGSAEQLRQVRFNLYRLSVALGVSVRSHARRRPICQQAGPRRHISWGGFHGGDAGRPAGSRLRAGLALNLGRADTGGGGAGTSAARSRCCRARGILGDDCLRLSPARAGQRACCEGECLGPTPCVTSRAVPPELDRHTPIGMDVSAETELDCHPPVTLPTPR
jgi:hypothetical protein